MATNKFKNIIRNKSNGWVDRALDGVNTLLECAVQDKESISDTTYTHLLQMEDALIREIDKREQDKYINEKWTCGKDWE